MGKHQMSDYLLYKLEIEGAEEIWIEGMLYAFGQHRIMVTDGQTTAHQF
jgi:hypothetical protein